MTLQEFVKRKRVTMAVEHIDSRPDGLMDDMPDGSLHYRCTLRKGGRRMTVYFSQGPAIQGEPTIEGVLSCLASDTDGAENFDSWCRDLGFDTDSRRAERIYKATVKATDGLRRLFNGSFDTLLDAERL